MSFPRRRESSERLSAYFGAKPHSPHLDSHIRGNAGKTNAQHQNAPASEVRFASFVRSGASGLCSFPHGCTVENVVGECTRLW